MIIVIVLLESSLLIAVENCYARSQDSKESFSLSDKRIHFPRVTNHIVRCTLVSLFFITVIIIGPCDLDVLRLTTFSTNQRDK